jgi:hypothetical protein
MAWDGHGMGICRHSMGGGESGQRMACRLHTPRPALYYLPSHASGQPDKAIMTGPGLSSRYRQSKVWGVGCYLLSMCNARPKQGAQPSASPSAPAKLIHRRFVGSICPPLPRCRGQPQTSPSPAVNGDSLCIRTPLPLARPPLLFAPRTTPLSIHPLSLCHSSPTLLISLHPHCTPPRLITAALRETSVLSLTPYTSTLRLHNHTTPRLSNQVPVQRRLSPVAK